MTGLYLHVPFRRGPRPHDEVVWVEGSAAQRERYLSALQTEIQEHLSPRLADVEVGSVYLGGGRPSLLSATDLDAIWEALGPLLSSSPKEVTMEIHPADVSPSYLRALRRIGSTRLSLEVLSFSDAILQAAQAAHTAADAVRAVETIQETEGLTLSIDLLFGLPDQSQTDWRSSLRRAASLNVPHVTVIESSEPGDTTGQLELAMDFLEAAGYEQYGLPHFAQPGHWSVHQEHYYSHGRYLGAGPSAESFWRPADPSSPAARRWTNEGDLDRYVSALRRGDPPVARCQALDLLELAREYVLLRLQTREGLDLRTLQQRYSIDLHRRNEAICQRLVEEGLVFDIEDRLQLTPKGRLVTDAITRRLLPTS